MICAGELAMADDAFALSPISARAARPREEDYDAISEAFMETSRGRWFLSEYARRNRNADTRMVLDAVARIEENLAAQRYQLTESRLPEAPSMRRDLPPRPRSMAWRRKKRWRRSARAPASSGRSHGGCAKSAPTSGF